MNNEMTAGQLAQIYNIAKQQGCDHEKTNKLIHSGILSDFFRGNWDKGMRWELRFLGAGNRFNLGELVRETGTIMSCKSVVEKATNAGFLRKEGDTLHFDMKMIPLFSEGKETCYCAISMQVEHWESLVRSLKKEFSVNKVVFHTDNTSRRKVTFVEFDQGSKGELDYCTTYPVIKGLGMRWEFET
ncbi:MAG: hypothetical protein KBC33_02885 [Candidatus Pacebacteria bacterium]|nr:hypothetical protein [Candidatus Paceibacterota bacterium]